MRCRCHSRARPSVHPPRWAGCARSHRSGSGRWRHAVTGRGSTARGAAPPAVETVPGVVAGHWVGGAACYPAIPYAHAPVGAMRWVPPRPHGGWTGIGASSRGAAVPQLPSRLDEVMGPLVAGGFSEDALTLSVWVPPGAPPTGGWPVIVWHHGGRLIAGAGSAQWFDAAILARRLDSIVVTVNYRLGALGFLYFPSGVLGDEQVANLGLRDQGAAWIWVRDNISGFGGDPGNVTAIGQSAGGYSVAALADSPVYRHLVHRTVVMSAPMAVLPIDPDEAWATTRAFMSDAGIERISRDAVEALPVKTILAVQAATMKRSASRVTSAAPIGHVLDGDVITENSIVAGGPGVAPPIEMLLGWNTEEARAYWAFDDSFWAMERAAAAQFVESIGGVDLRERFEGTSLDGRTPAELAVDLFGRVNVIEPSIQMAQRRASRHGKTLLYSFAHRSNHPCGRLGACHTFETPFLFGNFDDWRDAPMMAGSDEATSEAVSRTLQGIVRQFIDEPEPTVAGRPWPVVRTGDPETVLEVATSARLVPVS
ncbi:hypothetical protein E4P29_15555 [Rhodococcus sp. 1R11]|uniref:carboxylesterase family protein n=1 Tax=Rhodococcus sp. 1R11 TaxID=2559614 RepID=UPI001072701D|nr:carboxylesterase family protein [Rhodococcus sp. 1R11]TFI42482.1 hypothetical protein E4P29_15555 [Rhodococcus sp. 1R11]